MARIGWPNLQTNFLIPQAYVFKASVQWMQDIPKISILWRGQAQVVGMHAGQCPLMVLAGGRDKMSLHLALNSSTFWPQARATELVLQSLWLPHTQYINFRHSHLHTYMCILYKATHTPEITWEDCELINSEANLSTPYGLSLPSVKIAKEYHVHLCPWHYMA